MFNGANAVADYYGLKRSNVKPEGSTSPWRPAPTMYISRPQNNLPSLFFEELARQALEHNVSSKNRSIALDFWSMLRRVSFRCSALHTEHRKFACKRDLLTRRRVHFDCITAEYCQGFEPTGVFRFGPSLAPTAKAMMFEPASKPEVRIPCYSRQR